MQVLLINGSPNEFGCTYTALREVADELERNKIGATIKWLGKQAISGCMGCTACRHVSPPRCVVDDIVNETLDVVANYDGFVFGSPVHYAGASGFINPFLDRLFYTGGGAFAHKPGAVVTSARRAGTTATIEQLIKYITISQMPVVSSRYWPMVHGNTPEEVKQDLEGIQIMRVLGRNMAWMLQCIEAGKAAGFPPPEPESAIMTNFIR